MSVNINVVVNGNNVNSYYNHLEDIPIVSRNRDWTPVFDGFRMGLNSKVPTVPQKNNLVLVALTGYEYTITGSLTPDVTGVYSKIGTHNGKNLYSNGSYYIWYRVGAENQWVVGSTLDNVTVPVWYIASVADEPPLTGYSNYSGSTGTISLAQNSATYNHFLGYIDRLPFKNSDKLYEFEVKNYLMKLGQYRVRWDTLHPLLNNTANFTGAKAFTVTTSTNVVNCTAHGLSLGDVIQVKSTGVLPAPLEENTYYWVRIDDADTFRLYPTHSDWIGPSNQVDFTDTGSGTHSFALADFEKYVGAIASDNVQSAASLKWITEKIFELIGVVLDTSLIDDVIFHRFTIETVEYEWHWDEIYLDENMFYCLNQNSAIHHDRLDDTEYLDNQLTCLQFINDLFGKLGIAIKFIGNATTKTYLLIPQSRDADGIIQPDDEDNFTVNDSDKIRPVNDTIIDDQGGWIHSRNFRTNKADYVSATPLDLEEYTGKIRTNAGRTQIDWWNNLRFYLRDFTHTGYPFPYWWLYGANTYGYEFYNIPFYSVIINQTNALLNHSRQETECRADYLSQQKWTVKELKLDISSKRIKIIQEQNLLASG